MAEAIPERSDFGYFHTITTRWMDNDIYGHVNNVQYYSYFDTAVNHYLIEVGGLDIHDAAVIGVAVESQCTYRRPLSYPDAVEAGLRVEHLGNTSVRYGIGIFKAGVEPAAAWGYFVHVFVDRKSMQKTPIPPTLRAALARLEAPSRTGS